MKKVTTVLATFVAAIIYSSLVSSMSYADHGKMMIYRYPRGYYVQPQPQPPKPPILNVTPGPGEDDVLNDPGTLPPPATAIPSPAIGSSSEESSEDGSFVEKNIDNNGVSGFGTFRESNQRAVISWNGYEDERGEETLILTTKESSAIGQDMAMLSVLPLPGRPIAIEEADTEIFNKTQELLSKKLSGASLFGRVVFNRKIGPHNIFVWELDDINAFKREVTAYVTTTYKNEATVLIDERTEKIVGEYFKRGFRYFAFDLTIVKEKPANKIAISYRFKSKHVYFPLQISQVGAKESPTFVELIVMSPGEIVQDSKIRGAKYTETAEFSMAEVAGLNPELAKVFGNRLNTVKVRKYMFSGKLNGYNGDFTCKNSVE